MQKYKQKLVEQIAVLIMRFNETTILSKSTGSTNWLVHGY